MKSFIIIAIALTIAGCIPANRQPSPSGYKTPVLSGSGPADTLPDTTAIKGSKIDLSNRGLTKLNFSSVDNTSIIELDVSYNNLTGALPAEIRHFISLKILRASNNKFTGVPAEIGQLANLEVLDLSNNQLTGLPYELGNLKKLKTLNLSGNAYSQQDLEVILRGLPADVQVIK